MNTRVEISSGLAIALLCSLGACTFEDRVKHCDTSEQCQANEECYEGFCIRSDGSEDGDAARGGNDESSGGRGGRGSVGSMNNANSSAGAGGRGSGSGGDGTGEGTSGDDPPGGSGTGSGGRSAGGSGTTGGPSATAGSSGPAAGSGQPPAADGGRPPGSDPMPQCAMSSAEQCNGMDDDCDGETDEQSDVGCFPDGQKGCSESNGNWSCQGVCVAGTRTCSDGKLGDCTGFKAPTAEACTAAGMQAIDENCDGKTDESCACMAGETRSCYSGRDGTLDVGICKAGKQACDNGMLGACTDAVTPGTETCGNPNADDDCDGKVDNIPNLDSGCIVASNQGICRGGILRCEAGKAEPTCVTIPPIPESCNSLDDDCNGKVDDTFDLQTDLSNCGACGMKCPADNTCKAGKCEAPMQPQPTDAGMMEPMPGTCSPACGSGQMCCGGSCSDLSNDVKNCGACGNTCTTGSIPGCCNGRCVDLMSNGNCGQCGRDCSLLLMGGLTCSCTMGNNGAVECTGPVLNVCL